MIAPDTHAPARPLRYTATPAMLSGRPALAREDTGELVHAGLARRVGVGGELRHPQPVDAADIDHSGGIVRGSCRLKQRQERPREAERRLEVEVESPVPGRGRELLQGRAPGGAGVVDQDMDTL